MDASTCEATAEADLKCLQEQVIVVYPVLNVGVKV